VPFAHTFGTLQTAPLSFTDLPAIVSLTLHITTHLGAILDNHTITAGVQSTMSLLALLVAFGRHRAVYARTISHACLCAVIA